MATETQNDRLLSHIIVYGFSLAFGLVIASLQALKRTPTGFAIQLSYGTLVALVSGAAIMLPFFHVILHTQRKSARRAALAFVVVVGIGSFFYPMRVVPPERLGAVFIGLAAAVVALSILAGLLVLLYRFFETDEKENEG